MNLGSSTRFVAQSVAVGLTAAVVLLFLLPRFAPREVVELVQAPAPAAGADRSSYAEAVAAAGPAPAPRASALHRAWAGPVP